MSVEIKYEKIMHRGERKIKILKVSALEKEKLPVQYTTNQKCFWMVADGKSLYFQYGRYLREEAILPVDSFEKMISRIKDGGNLLKEINEQVAKLAAGWHGVKTLRI